MSGPVSPPPQRPSPRVRPPIDLAAFRDRLERTEKRVENLFRIVRPKPSIAVHELANGYTMATAQDGHALTYDDATGTYRPQPNLSELLFHNGPGSIVAGLSGKHKARYGCNVYSVTADLTVYGSGTVTFSLVVGGVTIHTFNMTSDTTGEVVLIPSEQVPLLAFGTPVQIDLTSIGTGCEDLVVHVALFVPVPSGT